MIDELRIVAVKDGDERGFVQELSRTSCWGRLLGPWALPREGAIDELGAFLGAGRPDEIRLRGCPSACLLPLLWIRTIWFSNDWPRLVIEWDRVDDPAGQRGRQAAGKLACLLCDEIRCAEDAQARAYWGIEPEAPLAGEAAFDLLTNLVDLWDTDLDRVTQASQWNEAMRRALVRCGAGGHRRVGIYGAGTHTRAVGDALMEPSVEIACLIDDDARRHGERMWGYEIVSPQQALRIELDAVVISANSIENQLWARGQVFREQGIRMLRLYGAENEQESAGRPAEVSL